MPQFLLNDASFQVEADYVAQLVTRVSLTVFASEDARSVMALEGMYIGRYHFIRLLGSGGMGEVYLAEDPRIKQQVAIKVIRAESGPYPDDNATKEASRLFEREAIAVAGLDHPHILPLFDYGEAVLQGTSLTYLVMPFRPEGSLVDWLHQRGSAALLSEREVAQIISQTAGALQHAHDRQIIHQDVKPSNLLIREQKETPNTPDILLADFGIAKSTTGTSSLSQVIRGTPTYMAPEQWEAQPVFATDQYALAVMAYELLTGRPPFQGGSVQMMYQHFNVQPEPASKINTSLLADIDVVLLQALAKKPRERFDSIAAFAQALHQATHATDVSTPIKPPHGSEVTRVPSFKMPVGPPKNDEIRATLTVSQSEAKTGISRKITLPGGRQVIVTVPAGAQDGQVIRLEGLIELSTAGGPAGTLIITLSVKQAEQTIIPSRIDNVAEKLPKPPVVAPVAAATPPLIENQISIKRQAHSRRRAMLLISLALLVIAGSTAGIFGVIRINQIATDNANATGTSLATTINNDATATATAKANATANSVATATANSVVYPNIAGNYSGTIHNDRTNQPETAMTLVISQDQGSISGDFTVASPLNGSGPFTGSIGTNKMLQFIVTTHDVNPPAPIKFTGILHSDASLSGQYCSVNPNNECDINYGGYGIWSVTKQ
jgi:serine/threonine protein kinase